MASKTYSIKNLILDMDGVLWRGETPMPGLANFFGTLYGKRLGFVLATNNATKTVGQYVEKLARFGVEVTERRVLTSAEATAMYLQQHYPEGAEVYVVGEIGLKDAIHDRGFRVLESDGLADPGNRAQIVVVGLTRTATYSQLAAASHHVNLGASFIGTNPDVTYPSEIGPLPGAGALLAFVQAATGVWPTIIGKPHAAIFEEALIRLSSTPTDTVMVGDRLNTDIAGGQAAGLRTILLLSGVSKRSDVGTAGVKPDWIFQDLIELTEFLNGQQD